MKKFSYMLDRALEHWFRVGGYALAGICGLIGISALLFNPLLGFGMLICAAACTMFARVVVPDIRESSDRHPFLARTVLVPVKIAVLVTFISALMELGHLSKVTLPSGLLASCQLMCAVFASRVVWQLERRWYPGRITHPLFGRWLEWKGSA
jgi:hypothetical protein